MKMLPTTRGTDLTVTNTFSGMSVLLIRLCVGAFPIDSDAMTQL